MAPTLAQDALMMRPPLAALALAAALWAGIAAAAVAGPREDALAVTRKWTTAFQASDVDALVALYAPDALFMGTGSTSLVTDTAGVRAYFDSGVRGRTFTSVSLVGEPGVMVLSDTAVLITGLDRIVRQDGATSVVNSGRVSFLVAKRGDRWQIVHFHRSAMPG
jgi:uncharacterized protein (TIGR02246 family)